MNWNQIGNQIVNQVRNQISNSNSNQPIQENQTDFAAFNEDVKNLNTIGTKITNYLDCYKDGKRGDDECDRNDSKKSMNVLRDEINKATLTYTNYSDFQADVNDLTTGINSSTTQGEHVTLLNKHSEVKKLRNELDQKMREIYEADDTDIQIMDNSSSYITLTWTVLAISLLYYLFRKL